MSTNHWLFLILLSFLNSGCYTTERNCKDFKTGKFEFDYEIDGKKVHSEFIRNDSLEISFIEQKIDTASIRWINDCEYIVQKLHPKNRLEKKAVHIKILTTSKTGYTFEFSLVGNQEKQQGTVTKIK